MKKLNLVAAINQLGYGCVGINLLKTQSDIALWPIGPVDCAPWDLEIVKRAISNAQFFDPNAACLRVWHQFDMAQMVGRGPKLGYSFFETDQLRSVEKHHLMTLDYPVVSSNWAKQILMENGIPNPIIVAPPGVDSTVFNLSVEKANLPETVTDRTTVFLNVGKWELRKGHDFVLAAFNAAFEPTDDVFLIMNCYNPVLPPEKSLEWKHYFMNSKMGQAGKIYVFDDRLPTQKHVAQLMQAADCGFFPSRAEGWGLESAEMLAMGKNVILTDTTAHTEYAGVAGGRLIATDTLEPAYDGVFFDGTGKWSHLGQSQLDQAVTHLKEVYKLKNEGSLKLNEKGINAFSEIFTWANCFDAMAERV